jgi:hypothetical protein
VRARSIGCRPAIDIRLVPTAGVNLDLDRIVLFLVTYYLISPQQRLVTLLVNPVVVAPLNVSVGVFVATCTSFTHSFTMPRLLLKALVLALLCMVVSVLAQEESSASPYPDCAVSHALMRTWFP